MKYPNNDLWSVRQIEFFCDALDGYENCKGVYYPDRQFTFEVPGICTYRYAGILFFPGQDRTIVFEQGKGFGLNEDEIRKYLKEKNISVESSD